MIYKFSFCPLRLNIAPRPIFDHLQHPAAIDPALSDNISICLVVVTVYEFGVRLQTLLVKGCVFRTSGARLASSYDFIQSLGNTFRVLIDKVAVITGPKNCTLIVH